jgi:hypothetical protein
LDISIRITFEGETIDERYWLDEKKETIYEARFEDGVEPLGDVAFIKKD